MSFWRPYAFLQQSEAKPKRFPYRLDAQRTRNVYWLYQQWIHQGFLLSVSRKARFPIWFKVESRILRINFDVKTLYFIPLEILALLLDFRDEQVLAEKDLHIAQGHALQE